MVGKILRALVLAHEQARISEAGLRVVGTFGFFEVAAAGSDEWVRDSGPQGKTRAPTDVKVFANKTYKAGELVLVPVPKSASNITSTGISDRAIETVHMDEKSNPYKIVPSVCWEPKTAFLHPFWLARKIGLPQAANLQIVQLSVLSTVKCQGEFVTGLADQLHSETTAIPVWTNPKDIEEGAEIICYVPAKKEKPKQKAASTWASKKTT